MPTKTKWTLLPVPDHREDYQGHKDAMRLNSLGSLFFFTKHTLGKNKLTTLHKMLCTTLENADLQLVMQLPMSSYKTTLGIGLSIFWALPFTSRDEDEMRKLGYGDEWIRYMKLIHNQNHRTLVTHEILDQAVAIGRGVDEAYERNDIFREVFRDIIPDNDCIWNNKHKFHKRLPGGDATTGTYEYRGVGNAFQGIHVNSIINDDTVGREAQQSVLRGDGSVMQSTITWWQQCGTRYDPDLDNYRQLVIGNPWCHGDLNDWIEKNLDFKFETHDAEGGCCAKHPAGRAIFPEGWPLKRLREEERRLDANPETKGDYLHFYRCKHKLPGEQILDTAWLREYKFKEADPRFSKDDLRNALMIEHKAWGGVVVKDMMAATLEITIIVDPKHERKVRREGHVILSIGFDSETSRIYILGLWQQDSTYSILVEEMYKQYRNWTMRNGLRQFRTPTVYMGEEAKNLLDFYLRERDKREKIPLDIVEFEDDHSLAAMMNRIKSLEPTFKAGQIWTNPGQGKQKEMLADYENYPAGKLDALEVLGHYTKIVDITDDKSAREFLRAQQENSRQGLMQ